MPRLSCYPRLFLSMSVLAMAACSGGPQGVEPDKTAAPVPPVMEREAAAVNEPDMDDFATPSEAAVNAAPMPLTADDRLDRLEMAVAMLRADYDRMLPAFSHLNTTNTRIQALLDQMETERTPASAPVAAAPVPAVETASAKKEKKAVPKVEPKATVTEKAEITPSPAVPVPAGAVNAVRGLRIGQHPGKTRLVIDLAGTGKPQPAYDLDNKEKVLLVDLPATPWGGAKSGKGDKDSLVSAWTARDNAGGGSSLAVQLGKQAKILSTEYLKPEGAMPARLVVDIAPAG